jgi:hypothetical protein
MKTVQAIIGDAPATLEVADTPETRAEGFMFRESCPEHNGILFVYDEDVETGYTMENVTIPLSVALLNKNMRILEVIDMHPGARHYAPAQPYRYAVEMPQGWFDAHCLSSNCVIDFDQ